MEPQDATQPTSDARPPETLPVAPQQSAAPCPTCGDGMSASADYAPTFVYALGRVEAQFPSLGVEKEFAQAGARAEASGTDAAVMKKALQANRYLTRQICWVFRISGLETYLLRPRDPADLALLVDAVREDPASTDIDLVIGVLDPQPMTCGVVTLPVVTFDQLYSFDRAALLAALPRPEEDAGTYDRSAGYVLDTIALMTDNAGATDEHRALNYLAVRYPGIYETTAQAHGRNQRLADIRVEPSPVSTTRRQLDVVWTYADRATDVPDRYFCRVDVEEEFPFLVTRLAPYYRR